MEMVTDVLLGLPIGRTTVVTQVLRVAFTIYIRSPVTPVVIVVRVQNIPIVRFCAVLTAAHPSRLALRSNDLLHFAPVLMPDLGVHAVDDIFHANGVHSTNLSADGRGEVFLVPAHLRTLLSPFFAGLISAHVLPTSESIGIERGPLLSKALALAILVYVVHLADVQRSMFLRSDSIDLRVHDSHCVLLVHLVLPVLAMHMRATHRWATLHGATLARLTMHARPATVLRVLQDLAESMRHAVPTAYL